jgi:hypothetical protein
MLCELDSGGWIAAEQLKRRLPILTYKAMAAFK